jgi:hypothetical protein
MNFKPEKAYKNLTFLNSPPARTIRILSEYEEPRQRFLQHGVRDTIVVFGSARARPLDQTLPALESAQSALALNPDDALLQKTVQDGERAVRLSHFYEQARELSRRLTEWSLYREGLRRYTICTGGGPGMMEAANRGASEVENGRSIGLGISLPFEPGVNVYTTKELAFEFHYFFTRKLWFVYLMRACILFPGGFGTFDELFELLTLLQTGKVKRRVPIVLFGTEYWSRVVNFEAMAEYGTVSLADLSMVFRTDSVDDAFRYIIGELDRIEARPLP